MTDGDPLPAEVAGEIASALLPGTGEVTTRLLAAVQDEWNRNRSKALALAEQVSGLTREDLAERIEHEPNLVPLLTRLLYHAAMTGQDQILEAMGAVFGAAIVDVPRVADYELVLTGLQNLRATDVLLAREIRDCNVFDERSEKRTFVETDDTQSLLGLAAQLQMPDEAVRYGLVRLVGQGFASSMGALGGERYETTELGRLLYDALERMTGR